MNFTKKIMNFDLKLVYYIKNNEVHEVLNWHSV